MNQIIGQCSICGGLVERQSFNNTACVKCGARPKPSPYGPVIAMVPRLPLDPDIRRKDERKARCGS